MDDDDIYSAGSSEASVAFDPFGAGDEEDGAVGGAGDDDDEPPFDNEEVRFENEYNVYERIGGVDLLGELGTGEADLRDPLQRLTQFTKTVAQEMITQGIIFLKKPDVQYIINQIPDVPNPKYKNPTALVLGFWVTKRDGTIDKDRVKKLIPDLPSLTYPVKDYDVIRYANLWIETKLYLRD